MNWQLVPPIISAVGTALVALIGAWFYQRRQNKKQSNNSMVDNYQTLYIELRHDIGRLREEQAEERKQWAEERKQFNDQIKKMQEEIRSQDKVIHNKQVEVVELRGEVKALTAQLEVYKEAHTTKNVTVTT